MTRTQKFLKKTHSGNSRVTENGFVIASHMEKELRKKEDLYCAS